MSMVGKQSAREPIEDRFARRMAAGPDDLRKAAKEPPPTPRTRRGRLPMVTFGNGYTFDTPAGPKALLDLFDGRGQLIVHAGRVRPHLRISVAAPAGMVRTIVRIVSRGIRIFVSGL